MLIRHGEGGEYGAGAGGNRLGLDDRFHASLSGENENMRRHQSGRKQLFSPAQAPKFAVLGERLDDQMAEADKAVADTALV